MQVQVVRHDRGAEHADGYVQAAAQGFPTAGVQSRQEAAQHRCPVGPGQPDLDDEADGDDCDEQQRQCFEEAHAPPLGGQQYEGIAGRYHESPKVREAEEEVQGDDDADDLGQVAGGDGDFSQDPQRPGGPAGVALAAGLRQVAAGDDAQPGGQGLEEHRHQVGHQEDPKQQMAVL